MLESALKFTNQRIDLAKEEGVDLYFPECFLNWNKDTNEVFRIYGCTYVCEAQQACSPSGILPVLSDEEIQSLGIEVIEE